MQFVYLAVSCAGVAVAVLFFFSKLPEVPEAALRSASIVATDSELGFNDGLVAQKPLYKEYNMMFGFVAQFCYVGAQVTCATFFINYANENGGYSTSAASRMLSYALITFTVGRFIATGLAVIFESNFLLVIYSCCAIALSAYVSAGRGSAAVGALIAIFFFMAPCYPVRRNLITPVSFLC